MREAVGSTFLFKLMIIFIFFFASFLAIAINYSQAFKIKNQIINVLEQYEGYNDTTKEIITSYISGSGYYRTHTCNSDTEGEMPTHNSNRANGVCILKQGTEDKRYYKVTTYVSFNFPIIGNIFTFPVVGETKIITNVEE